MGGNQLAMQANYQEIKPSQHLASMIQSFWKLDVKEDTKKCIIPDGCTDILLRVANGVIEWEAIGAMTKPLIANMSSGEAFIGIRFRPGMSASIFPVHGALLTNQILPLQLLWKNSLNSTTHKMLYACDFEERVFLLESMLTVPDSIHDAQIAIDKLVLQHGDITLEELSDIAHLSERQFRRQCIQRTGLAPKLLMRIMRFYKVASELQKKKHIDIALLAAEYGYFDQAHMIHDFQTFAGASPTRYISIIADHH